MHVEPPPDVEDEIRSIWATFSPVYQITPADVPEFLIFCHAFDRWKKMQAAAGDQTILDSKFGPVESPYLTRADKEAATIQKALKAIAARHPPPLPTDDPENLDDDSHDGPAAGIPSADVLLFESRRSGLLARLGTHRDDAGATAGNRNTPEPVQPGPANAEATEPAPAKKQVRKKAASRVPAAKKTKRRRS